MGLDDFFALLTALPSPLHVLEVGTRRWDRARPTTHRNRVLAACPGAAHTGVDVEPGDDVDEVCDAHRLHEHFPAGHFGAALCVATLEHLERPWAFAESLAAVCRPGAPLWIDTHQSFPLHGYPHDYWRFSTEALAVLFGPGSGWRLGWSGYHTPARIEAPGRPDLAGLAAQPAWCNVACLAWRSPP